MASLFWREFYLVIPFWPYCSMYSGTYFSVLQYGGTFFVEYTDRISAVLQNVCTYSVELQYGGRFLPIL